MKKHSCCKPCPPTKICYVKKNSFSSILSRHFRQRSSSEDIFSRNMWHARISHEILVQKFLDCSGPAGRAPSYMGHSFASWKASIAAAILAQVLGEAVLSRVFKHCGHCTGPGLKAAMHLPQHLHGINLVGISFAHRTLFCAVNFLVHHLGRCSQKLKSLASKFPCFIFVSLVSKCTMPLERIYNSWLYREQLLC